MTSPILLNASPPNGLDDMLCDESKRSKMFTGTSPAPLPGGSGFEKTLLFSTKRKNNNFIINIFIILVIN